MVVIVPRFSLRTNWFIKGVFIQLNLLEIQAATSEAKN